MKLDKEPQRVAWDAATEELQKNQIHIRHMDRLQKYCIDKSYSLDPRTGTVLLMLTGLPFLLFELSVLWDWRFVIPAAAFAVLTLFVVLLMRYDHEKIKIAADLEEEILNLENISKEQLLKVYDAYYTVYLREMSIGE